MEKKLNSYIEEIIYEAVTEVADSGFVYVRANRIQDVLDAAEARLIITEAKRYDGKWRYVIADAEGCELGVGDRPIAALESFFRSHLTLAAHILKQVGVPYEDDLLALNPKCRREYLDDSGFPTIIPEEV